MNIILFCGALLGGLSVGLDAYAEHGLRFSLSEAAFHSFKSALHFHQMHALLVTSLGLILLAPLSDTLAWRLQLNSGLFIVSILLFSFSIYAAIIFEMPGLKSVAPFGGTLAMIAWLLLAVMAVFIKVR